jgi:hypothetical protein
VVGLLPEHLPVDGPDHFLDTLISVLPDAARIRPRTTRLEERVLLARLTCQRVVSTRT